MKPQKNNKFWSRMFVVWVVMYAAVLVAVLISRGRILAMLMGRSMHTFIGNHNFVPFRSVSHDLAVGGLLSLNLTGNIIMFIPVGIIFCCIFKKRKAWSVVACAMISISVEVLQLTLKTGTFDVDDIITNTLGGILGAIMYGLIFLATKRNAEKTKTAVAVAASIFPPFLLSYIRYLFISLGETQFELADAIILLAYFIPINILLRKQLTRKGMLVYNIAALLFALFFYGILIRKM